ncbi:thiamine phosphate synthase [Solibacillus sp. FSL K6-1523]|uniref:thiamine phosphate synthase n=1 Tax=Solibacillus sp. FSL K6-1523 TaxID=2921471 RepID=UPI0030F94D2A
MKRHELDVYFIMGTINCTGDPLVILEKALQAGITMFQLREKGEGALTGLALEQFAKSCQKLCRQYNVPFIVNDHVELALEMNADGVHIGQDDTDLAQIRTLFPGKCIGVSVHSMEEMDAAVTGGADYVGIGPIFETTSKLDAKNAAGVTFLTQAREAYPSYPIVAIGGITTGDAPEVRAAGADGVAVISVICQSTNIMATVKALKNHSISLNLN